MSVHHEQTIMTFFFVLCEFTSEGLHFSVLPHANKDLILCCWCHVELDFRRLRPSGHIKLFLPTVRTGLWSILSRYYGGLQQKVGLVWPTQRVLDEICFNLNLRVRTWCCLQVQVSTSPVCYHSAPLQQPVSRNIQQPFSGLGPNLWGIRQTFSLPAAVRYFPTTHKGASVRSSSRNECHMETGRSKCQVTSGFFLES